METGVTPRLYVMVGLPGSGKSAFRPELLRTRPHAVAVSSDDIIERMSAEAGLSYDEGFSRFVKDATKNMHESAGAAFGAGLDVIWDQTNLSVKKRKALLSRKPKRYEAIAVHVYVPEELRQQRLAERPGKTIPPSVDRSMIDGYVSPSTEEGFDDVWLVRGWDRA